jgi:diguanylate cyclase (GGDEF)-like protein
MGITEDITEQKRAREEIELSNTILRTEQEVSPDAILVVNENQKIISYNQQFIDLWKLPDYMVHAHLDAPVLKAVADQVENPEAFVERVLYLYQHRNEKSREEILLSDGKIIDRYSAPIAATDGKYYGRVWYFRDITERKRDEELIRNLAFNDALTNLPNRRLLLDRMKQAMVASKRSGRYGAVMFLDLDNFKPLNDLYGHDMGDLLLIEVANRIARCVREIDTVARFGGDEFVVMLSELDADREFSSGQASIVAEKIRVALAEPYLLTSRQPDDNESTIKHHCSSSIGVVLFINNETSPEEVLKWADIAMYRAKAGGRNRVCFYDEPI